MSRLTAITLAVLTTIVLALLAASLMSRPPHGPDQGAFPREVPDAR